MKRSTVFLGSACFALCSHLTLLAVDPPPPAITNINLSGQQKNLRFDPLYPAAQVYTILSGTNLSLPLAPNTNFFIGSYIQSTSTNGTNFGYEWRSTNEPAQAGVYRVQVTTMNSNALLAATVLNRLTYGPTPDEIERISTIGPDAYIAEQLAPWSIPEDVDITHTNIPFIANKFVEATNFVYNTNATISDLRAWHLLRAVGAKRQFLEIMLQFLENHFVTQWSKSETVYFPNYYSDGNMENILAAQLEYLENEKWRNALLNPQCTFYDLLKISAESPAMIIYLDTYSSKGNGSNIANENYARELMELFSMGVDNGYDQTDITTESRIWTGWNIDKVDFTNAFNPFAPATTTIIPGSTNTSTTTKSNLYGVWAFNYRPSVHNTSTKSIFTNKFIPPRFGLPWTAKTYGTNSVPGLYQIVVPGHTTTDTNGVSEGYQFITHIANLPFTEEYISIKLCRLLVHDDFPNPSNDTNSPSFAFYNYAGGNLSPEADLVRNCMLAWETNSPQGQIWQVIQTIVGSDLFRSHGASQQKVKTPLEFAVSTVRSLRSTTNGSNTAGSFTAFTDGYNIGGTSSGSATILSRAGNMLLFDRDAPDGYPETAPAWVSAGTLSERLRFAQSFCTAIGQSGHGVNTNDAGSNTGCDIVGLIKAKLPASNWTNAPAVADYLLGTLFPGEGAGNLAFYRMSALNYLNTDDSGNSSPFAGLTVSGTANSVYDNRVRGLTGMLMTFQRFQEQ
jgi:uncharacterized protein (DUF1800 family)